MRKESICKNIIKYIFLIPKNIYWNRLRRLQNHYVFQTRLIEIWHLQPTNNTLCIGYAAGSMTGGGWEMLQTHIKSYGGDVMLEGMFVLLPYIKKAALFFLLIVILFALFFSQGDLLILTECLILFMFPLYLLYRNISKIGKCEEGRRLVLLYLEKVLHANVEISVEEE